MRNLWFISHRCRLKPLLALALLAVGFLAASCQSTSPSQTSKVRQEPWSGFGEARQGKIMVSIGGEVRHPGQYYVGKETTLDLALTVFGGWNWPDDPPKHVIVTRQMEGGQQHRFRLNKIKKAELEAFKLKEGDVIYFPKYIW